MKLEIAMLVGPEAKQFLVDLTKQIDRLNQALPDITDVGVDKEPDEDEDEDFTPKKAAKASKKSAAFDEEDDSEDEEKAEAEVDDSDSEEAEGGDEEEDDDFPAPPSAPKKKRAKKTIKSTIDDVNDACRAYAKAKGRPATLKLLKKHFDTDSISALDEDQWAKCIKVMAL